MIRHARDEENAQALVEFALVLPIVLMLLFGMIQVGFVLHARQTVEYAARVAADTYALEHSERAATNEATAAGSTLRPHLRAPNAGVSFTLIGERQENVCTRTAWRIGLGRRCVAWGHVLRRHERQTSTADQGTPGELVRAVVTYHYPLPIRGPFGPLQFPASVTLTGEAIALIEVPRPVAERPGRRLGQDGGDPGRDASKDGDDD